VCVVNATVVSHEEKSRRLLPQERNPFDFYQFWGKLARGLSLKLIKIHVIPVATPRGLEGPAKCNPAVETRLAAIGILVLFYILYLLLNYLILDTTSTGICSW
jgi:hypothetical protein